MLNTDSSVLAGFVDKAGAAQAFGVHENTIDRWRNLPDGLPYVQVGGKRGRILINLESARKWLLRRETSRNPTGRRRSGRSHTHRD